MEHLAVLPPVGEKTALASSYDRASQYDAATDKYLLWGANNDGGGMVRQEDGKLVMADLKGPGCIWRIWSAQPLGGHVKIYLDGSTTPVIDLPFQTYFDRDHGPFPWKNLCYPAAGEPPAPNAKGANIYVPIPFQKSCKIVGDDGTNAQTIWGGYYHFNYTLFPAGTVVPTFQLPFSPENKAALDAANEKLNHCGDDPAGARPGEKTETQSVTLAPGAHQTVFNLQGPEAITALRIKVPPLNQPLDDEEKRNLLRQLTIGIKWDGEQNPSVWSPLGDFFATVGGAEPFATLPAGLQPDGTLYCVWYMPFGQSAQIDLGNDGPDAVPLTVTVTHAPLDRPIADFARFHAKWHRDSSLAMRPDRWPDWNFLNTQGRGRFVGMMLHAFVPVTTWWGEGDEKFFVDGEKFPSDFGTGTEDYFGYAWGDQNLFVRAYHAQPLNESNCGHVDDMRWHIAENVPFQTGFEADLEKYLYHDPMSVDLSNGIKPKPTAAPTFYAAEAYWYLAPGGTDPYVPLPVEQRVGYWNSWAKYNEPGVIEGESLKPVAHPPSDGYFNTASCAALTQQDAPDVFSGNRELDWETDRGWWAHEQMEVNIPVKKDGRYQVLLRLAKGPSAGILKIAFDENEAIPPVDCYAPTITAGDPVDLGTYELTAGQYPLTFMFIGVNPANKERLNKFGIDYVKLVPMPPIEPVHFRATGADDSSIHSITVGEDHPVVDSNGDTWDFAWTKQNQIYSPSNDSGGFPGCSRAGNLLFNKIIGNDPAKLDGRTVNEMNQYGAMNSSMGDNCTWKSSGCMALDGVLYWLIARHQYGGDQTVDYDKRQKAHGASFIKSTDLGKTWSGSAQDQKDHPMFPGSRFVTPYFVQYGQDGHEAWADGSDRYVYALSNNGYWDNGDYVILGRCLRAKMPELNGADWQFYTAGDGADDKAWTSNVREAKAVLCHPDHLGMTRAVYLPKHRCYLMIGWYYPDGSGKIDTLPGEPEAHTHTNWDFYVAAHPWGPWRVVGSHTWTPQGFYCPGICSKFNSADESTVWAFAAGDWRSSLDKNTYKLHAVPLFIK